MRKILFYSVFVLFLLSGCIEEADIQPRYYPFLRTEVTVSSDFTFVIFHGKFTEGIDKTMEYGFVHTLFPDTYLPGNYITFTGDGFKNYSCTLTGGLLPGHSYEVRAYAKTERFTVYGNAVEFLLADSASNVADIDGNNYHSVFIGNQEWMVENLRVRRYNNGDSIPAFNQVDAANLIEGAYDIYPHYAVSGIGTIEGIISRYGLLYNWYAVNDERGLCPAGWRIPTDQDWMQLEGNADTKFDINHPEWRKEENRGHDAGKHLRSRTNWYLGPQHGGNNHLGFYAFAGGYYNHSEMQFKHERYLGYFWSSSEKNILFAWPRSFMYQSGEIWRTAMDKKNGLSVRCMRDVVFNPVNQ